MTLTAYEQYKKNATIFVHFCTTHIVSGLHERTISGLTVDRPGSVRAVLHGVGVGPSLNIGCSLVVPSLCLWGGT